METRYPDIDPTHVVDAARDTLSVRRVFGEAYERDGALVIPVAKVWGGTGSGWGSSSGEGDDSAAGAEHRPRIGEGSGGGGGFGVRVKALGVYVVDDAGTRWQPALDLNRVILGAQAVGAVVAVVVAWAIGRGTRR